MNDDGSQIKLAQYTYIAIAVENSKQLPNKTDSEYTDSRAYRHLSRWLQDFFHYRFLLQIWDETENSENIEHHERTF